jgi:hypothetical protein
VSPSGSSPTDARSQVLIAEYTWVAGLVRYYREVEFKALAGTGIVLSASAAAFTALRGSENGHAEDIGALFAIAAWVTTFALPVVIMAQLRGLRASFYVREWLHPRVADLTGDSRYLAWEVINGALYEDLTKGFGRFRLQRATRSQTLLSSAVVVVLIGSASLALMIGALVSNHPGWALWLAVAAGVVDFIFMGVSLSLRRLFARHLSDADRDVLEKQAALAAHGDHDATGVTGRRT